MPTSIGADLLRLTSLLGRLGNTTMISRGNVIFGIICGLLGGVAFSFEAFHVFSVRSAPIVTGRIVARDPIKQFSIPRVDFTIQIEGSDAQVHAHTQRYLLNKIPDTVRFRYNGDPLREVFLFEHENNPYWIVSVFWAAAVGLTFAMLYAPVRRALGWQT